ncbi:MAG: MMPL family transporter [Dehalococcoidia bacterium]|nr:MMPL family transporter [Dehalococcoidia bacterium]
MQSFFSTQGLARSSARHPWLMVGLWVLIVAGAVFATTKMDFTEENEITGTDSLRADQLLEERLRGEEPASETIIVSANALSVDDAQYRDFVAGLTEAIRNTPGIAGATNYYEAGDESLVSPDRDRTLIVANLTGDVDDADETVEPLLTTLEANGRDGFEVLTVGDGSLNRELNEAFEKDLQSAEQLGLPAALVMLVLVFGAAVAAGIPVILGVLGIAVSVGATALLSQVFGVSSIVINMITMIGLAVGIDYSLFIIERFREERAKGARKVDAIVTAGNTASRAVLFSGITVIIALAGLIVVPATEFKGMAIGAITVVAAAVAIALTLLPALLSLLDGKINWLHLPGRGKPRTNDDDPAKGFFGKTTSTVIRHPVLSAAGATTLLLAMAAPVLAINLGSPGLSDFPENLESVHAYHVLNEDFSAGRIAPAELVIDGDVNSAEVQASLSELRAMLANDGRFAEISAMQANDAGTVGLVNIFVNGDPDSIPARETIQDLRSDYIPAAFEGTSATVYVGGHTAETVDYVDTMVTYLPIVIAFVLSLSFVLLMVVFRSIVIPVKAILMNLLSVGAAYGLVVAVFQEGVLAEQLGFQQSDSIAAFLPVFLFAILFGLSMDYHVFLLSRIQERFLHTGDNTGAVAQGLRSTAHIITGAAAIMMVVFGGFAMGDMVPLQQMGFGLAVAVFLDATIVRSVLVPASMELLGAANWYLPSWLHWLPRISVEGPVVAPAPQAALPELVFGPQPAGGK